MSEEGRCSGAAILPAALRARKASQARDSRSGLALSFGKVRVECVGTRRTEHRRPNWRPKCIHVRVNDALTGPKGPSAMRSPAPAAHAPTSGARQLAGQITAVVCFALALWTLGEWLRDYHYHDVLVALRVLPRYRVALALALTTCGYVILVGYDLLAFRFVHHRVPFPRVALGSFVSCALGNNLGNILVTGAAVRYWLYGSLGLSAAELTQVVLFCSLGFWLGFLFLGALLFVGDPVLLPPALHLPGATTRPMGIAFLVLLAAYAGLVMTRRTPLRIGAWRFPLPSPALTLGQLFITTLDLTTMGTALWVLLPPAPDLSYPRFLAIFLLALVSGAASQVPGGVGIFEAVVLLLLSPRDPPPDLAAALLVFRATYFILPLFVAAGTIGIREGRARVARGPSSLRSRRPLDRHDGAAGPSPRRSSSRGRCCCSPAPYRAQPDGSGGFTGSHRCRSSRCRTSSRVS